MRWKCAETAPKIRGENATRFQVFMTFQMFHKLKTSIAYLLIMYFNKSGCFFPLFWFRKKSLSRCAINALQLRAKCAKNAPRKRWSVSNDYNVPNLSHSSNVDFISYYNDFKQSWRFFERFGFLKNPFLNVI